MVSGAHIVAGALAWRMPARWVVLTAAIAAFAPDPLSYMSPVSEWFLMLPGASAVPWLHRTLHCDVTQSHLALGFITQAIVISLGLYVLARKRACWTKAGPRR